MPLYKQVPVEVVITVTIGDQPHTHVLRFPESATARGAAYHGELPPDGDPQILEGEIRGAVDTLIARATKDATRFLTNAYPMHTDTRGREA